MKVLVVGQGLAGSCMALTLVDRGVEVHLADFQERNQSTSVAAGLVNPLVLKRMKKVWRADEFVPFQEQFYADWQERLGGYWRHSVPVYRRFHDIAEQNQWMEISGTAGFSEYLSPDLKPLPPGLQGAHGMGKVNHAGWFDTQAFMDAVRIYFSSLNRFKYVEIDESTSSDFDLVIWAIGVRAQSIGGFPTDALRPSKGELLRIRLEKPWRTKAIIKAGVFILPIGERELRIGATYDHFDLSPTISEKGQSYLEEQVRNLIDAPYEIIGREWGIRPTTKDRRPILGRSSQNERDVFFNGLGSRGVLMAPLLASELADHLLDGMGLRPDVDIARFY
ncbi:FAD-binding oxidoreductase [Cryomorphaceae bacterium]|nr:FAD-binding oxidoreductase [Cryomorphaceae bacterium]